jgi:acetoin utilization protein AcuC
MSEGAAAIVWDPRFLFYDFGPGHPFSERSRGLAVDLLRLQLARERTPVEWIRTVASEARSSLERFHDPAYLDLVDRASAQEAPILLDAGDTPSFAGCFEEAARIVAGTERALAWTLEHRRPAFQPAGGLHHAHADRASGFCIFNDVALAVRSAIDRGHRVAYIDIDAHHGDGVMYGFYDSGKVLAIDFHQDGRTLFPGTGFPGEVGRGDGAGLKVNLPLPPTAGDEALRPLFRRVVPPLLRSFRPDVIVLQHGVDGHLGDRLAQLQYSSAAYDEIDATILALAREIAGARLVVTGGGGYRPDAVARVLARTGLALAGAPLPGFASTVPEDWREQYRHELGEPAPIAWAEADPPEPSRWRPELEEKLIGALESGLGRRLPAPGAPVERDRNA